MPHLAARSTSENVSGSSLVAAAASFWSRARRTARIWWRRRVLRMRLIAVRRSVMRTRFNAETVFPMNFLF
jgi:hypothetical protein